MIPRELSETIWLDNPESSEPIGSDALDDNSDPYGPASDEAITVPYIPMELHSSDVFLADEADEADDLGISLDIPVFIDETLTF